MDVRRLQLPQPITGRDLYFREGCIDLVHTCHASCAPRGTSTPGSLGYNVAGVLITQDLCGCVAWVDGLTACSEIMAGFLHIYIQAKRRTVECICRVDSIQRGVFFYKAQPNMHLRMTTMSPAGSPGSLRGRPASPPNKLCRTRVRSAPPC